jgi:hypothetical protein
MCAYALKGDGWRAWAPPIFLLVAAAVSVSVGAHLNALRPPVIFLFFASGAAFGAAVLMIIWNMLELTWPTTTIHMPPVVHRHSISISRTGARIAVAITFIPVREAGPPSA